jgi:hypothetical protein
VKLLQDASELFRDPIATLSYLNRALIRETGNRKMSINVAAAARQSFKKAGRRIKVSKNMRPFVSRVVRDGAVQKAFANQIGKPVGGCVASNVRAGMSGKVVHGIAKLCSRQAVGTHLNLGGLGRSAGRSSQATEYYEIE